MCYLLFCFFFKQKTAYEVRISDWSSDVCSSDLNSRIPLVRSSSELVVQRTGDEVLTPRRKRTSLGRRRAASRRVRTAREGSAVPNSSQSQPCPRDPQRSEERRVGKEGVGRGRSRWCPYH